MGQLDKIENTIVYKQKITGDDRGILVPVLSLNKNGELITIPRDAYPSGIFVSQGYNNIDNKYADDELFLLSTHYYDEDKSIQDNIKRYWTKGDFAGNTFTDILIPIVETSLPPVSTGLFPSEIIPPKSIFFILDKKKGKLYGPLKVTRASLSDNRQIVSPQYGDFLREYDFEGIRECIFILNINELLKKYITSFKELEEKPYKTIDYISDDQLIQYFNKQALGKNNRFLAKREAAKLQEEVFNFQRKNINNSVEKERIERLKSILDNYLNASDIGPQIIKEYFDSSKGKAFLEMYVKEHESTLLQEQLGAIESEVKSKESELYIKTQALEKQIEKKRIELQEFHSKVDKAREQAKLKIAQIEQETEEIRRQKLKDTEEELQSEIERLENQKKEESEKLEEVLKRLNLVNDLEEMNKQNIYLEQHQKKLEESFKGVQDALRNSDELSKRMGELSVVSRILKGDNYLPSKGITFNPLTFSSTEPTSGLSIIESVVKHFDEGFGREFSMTEIANVLVSITQSFLTILAGPPGVGKTSLVVRLATALGLGSPEDYKNFLYISVARGWVSSRDILGFYNSLNNTYQIARTGLYDFLKRPIDDGNNSLQLILLDEANLSPMEHYWSDFLGLCDKEGRNKPIDTGIPNEKQRKLFIPKNTRFIATINNDSTTERLSPRLIDRVPIIYLDQESELDNNDDFIPTIKFDGALVYEIFETFFNSDDYEIPQVYEYKLDAIISILKERNLELGQPIAISHRKRLAIRRYINIMKAQDLMDLDTAFDFAVSQHILPHIEGYGSKFQKRILNLQKEIGALYPRSNWHIERILASGNDFTSTYSFF